MLSTVWPTQRGSKSYTEKIRVRKETEVTRRRKGGIKRRETDSASNQFPKSSPPSGIHRDSQSWVEKRRGRQRRPGGEKGESKVGESSQASNLAPK